MKPEKVVARLGKNTIHILSTIDSSDYRILFGVATDPETSHLLICLAHLQSESHKILYIDFSKIEWITEEGHEGESVTLDIICAHNGPHDQCSHPIACFQAVGSTQRVFLMHGVERIMMQCKSVSLGLRLALQRVCF